MKSLATKALFRIAVPYVLFAGLWIFLSDRLLKLLSLDPATRARWLTYGDWTFVLVTLLLFAVLVGVELKARMRNEAALQRSEEKYRDMVEHANSIILRWTRDGRITFLNEFGQTFFGYSETEIIGRHVIGTIVPETDSTNRDLRPLMEQILKDPKAFERNVNQNMRRNGERVWIDWTNMTALDDQGQVREVLSIGHDITERKRAEEALHQSEELFRLIMENLADLVAVLDLNGHRIYNSPSYGRLLGDPEKLVGTPSFKEIHPEDRARVQEAFEETVRTGVGQRLHYRLVDQNGVARHIESQGTVIRDDQGQVSKVVVVSRDVTERHRTEEILQERETRYRFLFEHNPVSMLIYERGSLQMLAVNEAFMKNYGYNHDEALALHLTDLYREEEREKVTALASQLHGHFNSGEWHHRKHDGSFITIVGSSHDVTYQGRSARVAVFTDISDRKHMEEELRATQATLEQRVMLRTTELAVAKDRAEAADRLKSAFLATMSHELRTPLNSIIGFTGVLLQGLAGPLSAEQTKQLEMVRNSARHLLALINDVLDISKIEAGQLEVTRQQFDLRASIEKAVGLVRPLADKKGLALRVQLAPEIGAWQSDPRRVEQVLLNLLNNAVKFTERGEVALVAEMVPDAGNMPHAAVRMAVSDTGIGIKAEDVGKLFQPFRQIDSGLARRHEGTGLGLAICRRLADLLGGEIHAASEWSKGSVFTFTLPMKEPVKS